jgi:hypothetical protein
VMSNGENALRIMLSMDPQDENTSRLHALIHNLWTNVWISAVIYCKSRIFFLLL